MKHLLNILFYLIILTVIIIAGAGLFALAAHSSDLLSFFSFSIFQHASWDPMVGLFGISAFLITSIVVTVLTIALAFPVSVIIAFFIRFYLQNSSLRKTVKIIFEYIGNLPHIIIAMWGLFFLAPLIDELIGGMTGFDSGKGIFTTVVALTLMILPFMVERNLKILSSIPDISIQSALALGAANYEMIKHIVIPVTSVKFTGTALLSAGIVFPESIIMTMLIGDNNNLPESIFAEAQSLSSLVFSSFTANNPDIEISVLSFTVLIVLLITFIFYFAGKRLISIK